MVYTNPRDDKLSTKGDAIRKSWKNKTLDELRALLETHATDPKDLARGIGMIESLRD